MIIRPALAGDWPRVGELAERLVRMHYDFDSSRFVHPGALSANVYTAHVQDEIDRGNGVVHVADQDGRVVGYVFAGVEPENWKELRHQAGYIHDLVVDSAHRRTGVGHALIASAVDWFAARGVKRVMLWSAPQNADAQRLFRSVGFRPTMIEMTLDRE